MSAEPDPTPLTECCTPPTSVGMTPEDAARTAHLLKVLADPARLQLLSILVDRDDGEATVLDLTAPVGLTQPTVSHHLKVLADVGLVTREKRGVRAYYAVVPEVLYALSGHLGAHLVRVGR